MSRIAMHYCDQHHTVYAGVLCPLCARAASVRIDRTKEAAMKDAIRDLRLALLAYMEPAGEDPKSIREQAQAALAHSWLVLEI